MSETTAPADMNVEDLRKLLRTADRETTQGVLDAEHARTQGKRTTVITAAGQRLEQLDEVAETDPPSPVGGDGIPVLTDPELAAAPVAAQNVPADTETQGAPVEPADEAPAPADEAPAKKSKGKAAKVKPATYDDASWNLGQYAPGPVVRVLDKRTGQYGDPRTGELEPGESGEYLVQAGDTITRRVRSILG